MKVVSTFGLYLKFVIPFLACFPTKVFGNYQSVRRTGDSMSYLGVDQHGYSDVFISQQGSPEQNVGKVIDMMGGISRFIGRDDIVVLKPNAQRFNQGMTNTDTIKGFIDLVLAIPGFSGEIIIAENHQYQKDDKTGWVTEQRNGRYNLDELVNHYHRKGVYNVSQYRWRAAGPCRYPLEGNAQGQRRVRGPADGDGYVWMEDNYYRAPSGRKCLMTYPVFTSPFSGLCIDLKHGAWEKGRYLERKVRFINFAALNHHGRYAGVSASVKNLMGVVDMTCGFPGDTPEGTYNTHHIGVSRLKHWLSYGHWRISAYKGPLRFIFEDFCYRNFRFTGGVLGHFMANVRFPDLNIISAELVGWGDRRDMTKAFRPRTVLASIDPVALDYTAAREVLLSGTPPQEKEASGIRYYELNNPDDQAGPFFRFLYETHGQGIGNLQRDKIRLHKHLFS